MPDPGTISGSYKGTKQAGFQASLRNVTMRMAPHLYEPLSVPNAFRFLDLQPGAGDEPLMCSLRVDHLYDNVEDAGKGCIQFEALSYVWGTAGITHEILLDGRAHGVRKNLWQFLQQKRDVQSVRTLWIDALCIDQNNMQERGQQVRLMHRVYQSARTVVVWLGCGDQRITRAMQMMQSGVSSDTWAVPHHPEDVDCIFQWARLAYFTRTWVRQEFMSAKDLVILYGDVTVSWQMVRNFCFELVDVVSQKTSLLPQTWSEWEHTPAYNMVQRRSRQAFTESKLLDLLVENQETHCLEKVDKVFALLSMASDCRNDDFITIDYSRSAWQVLVDVLLHAKLHPKHTFRYAQFLAELLDVSSTGAGAQSLSAVVGQAASGRSQRTPLFHVIAYQTGEIIRVNGEVNGLPFQSTQYHGLSLEQCEDMTEKLDQIDRAAFQRAAQKSLKATCRRTQKQLGYHPLEAPQRVVVSFTCLRKRRTSLAISTGQVQTGDRVFHFPGHEVALVFDRGWQPDDKSHKGLLIAAERDGPKRDLLTSRLMSYHVLQNEAELQNSPMTIQLPFVSSQLLALIAASAATK